MLAVVLLEAAAIGLLGLLVAGLLRSHAEILRQLHHLGAGLEPVSQSAPAPVTLRSRTAGAPLASLAVAAVAGSTPGGETVSLSLDRAGELTLLVFLSSGCGTCQPLWEGMRGGLHRTALPGVRVVVVARDADEESPSLLAGLGAPDVTVVLSSRAWHDFDVPGSPYAVLVDGDGPSVLGSGVTAGWEQLGSLVSQHLGDIGLAQAALDGSGREARADAELLRAGIGPGHPSLHPEPGSFTTTRLAAGGAPSGAPGQAQ